MVVLDRLELINVVLPSIDMVPPSTPLAFFILFFYWISVFDMEFARADRHPQVFDWEAPNLAIEQISHLLTFAFISVGEFRKTRHPRNVEFNEVLKACFSGAGNSRFSEDWNLRSLEFANVQSSGILVQ
jgi:hypothetical protein